MSVHNAERYLRPAVESILAQAFTDFEFIIIDDGSTDRSPPILAEFASRDPRVRIETRANKGLTKSLNEAIQLSRGEYLARMDADDIAKPNRFQIQIQFMRDHPEVVLLGGGYELIDGAGPHCHHPPADDDASGALCRTPICHRWR
jgi:glycosyltransferase involved in cell wall biosynthesis